MIGMVIFAIYVLLAIFGRFIAPYDPNATSTAMLQAPSGAHLLGTTQTGQDIFSQLVVGAKDVMLIGIAAGVFATILAAIVGVSAGFLRGFGDESLSMLTNIFLVIPSLPLMIIILTAVPNAGSAVIILVIGLTSWAWGARVLRSQTLSLRNRDFVEAARATGESKTRIIFFEILPNLTAILASTFISAVTHTVLSLVTLAYIGVMSLTNWNWGTILYYAQSAGAFSQGAWWWFVPAGLAVAILGMSLALINFGIDEFVNPRLRNTGMNARALKKRGIRPRIGFTPIAHDLRVPARPMKKEEVK
jgi:peptide/nickel transport system permease protein